jgi:hypothetical protein
MSTIFARCVPQGTILSETGFFFGGGDSWAKKDPSTTIKAQKKVRANPFEQF